MNCLVGISVTLIALVAGMLLLAKTQKDNLGIAYKAVSYFVIIAAFIGFLCGIGCGICRMAHCGKGGGCSQMQQCGMMGMGMMGCDNKNMMMGCGKGGMMECGKKGRKKCKKMCRKSDMTGMGNDGDDDKQIGEENMEKKPEEPSEK